MFRLTFCMALFCLFVLPARAQTPFPCRLGPFAKDGHLVAEAFAQVADARAGRVEYRLRVRNPHPWPAAVLPGISAPGVVEAPARPVVVPPREAREVLIGWAPRQGGGPGLDFVRVATSIPFCVVLAPDAAAPSAHPAVPSRRLQVVRDEGAQQVLQRL